MDLGKALAQIRVPAGWMLGLAALVTARPTPGWLAAGLGLSGLGEVVRIWAAGHLVKDRALATRGPYARTRNPLYFGTFFVGSGFALATGHPLWVAAFLSLFVFVYVPVMNREASRLAGAFPSYREYASRVPLFLPNLGRTAEEAEAETERKASGVSFSWQRVRANGEHLTLVGWLVAAAVLALRL